MTTVGGVDGASGPADLDQLLHQRHLLDRGRPAGPPVEGRCRVAERASAGGRLPEAGRAEQVLAAGTMDQPPTHREGGGAEHVAPHGAVGQGPVEDGDRPGIPDPAGARAPGPRSAPAPGGQSRRAGPDAQLWATTTAGSPSWARTSASTRALWRKPPASRDVLP